MRKTVLTIVLIMSLITLMLPSSVSAQFSGFSLFFPTIKPYDYITTPGHKIFITDSSVLWDTGKSIPINVLMIAHAPASTSQIPAITATLALKFLPDLIPANISGTPLLTDQTGRWILLDTATALVLLDRTDNRKISIHPLSPILGIFSPITATPVLVTTSGIYLPSGEVIIRTSTTITGCDIRENLVAWTTSGKIMVMDKTGNLQTYNLKTVIDAGSCNPPLILGADGNLITLTSSTPTWLASLPPNSYILGCFAITPLGTFSASGGTLKRYSSWLKSVQIAQITNLSGEVVMIPTQGEPIISTEDFSFLSGSPIKYTHDEDTITANNQGISINEHVFIPLPAVAACQAASQILYIDLEGRINGPNWQTPLPIPSTFLGCSPTMWAAVGREKTVIGDVKTGNILASVPTPQNLTDIYYGQGYIWIATPDGVYRLPIYRQRIELIIGSTMVRVNGKEHYIDVAPVILPPGRTFVPLRFVSESMGAKVSWHPENRSIDIQLEEHTIKLQIGSTTATVDGVAKQLDAAPFIDPNSNRTLVPIRFVAEFLGAKVYWIGRLRKVIIVR